MADDSLIEAYLMPGKMAMMFMNILYNLMTVNVNWVPLVPLASHTSTVCHASATSQKHLGRLEATAPYVNGSWF